MACWDPAQNRVPGLVAWSKELPTSVDYRAFCHETEDPEKVRRAVRNAAHADSATVEETPVEGAHGNRVLILETTVKSANTVTPWLVGTAAWTVFKPQS